MELTKGLGIDRPIFVMDDGALLAGRPFNFASIADAAAESLVGVKKFISSHGIRCRRRDHGTAGTPDGIDSDYETVIALGGWSYGGVVAAEVAKLLQQSSCGAEAVTVEALFLFDAPLRSPTAAGVAPSLTAASSPVKSDPDDSTTTGSADSSPQSSPPISPSVDDTTLSATNATNATSATNATNVGAGKKEENSEGDELAKRTNEHFALCTALLHTYHQRPLESRPLLCDVYDIRPTETAYACSADAITELTVGAAHHSEVPGSHWTMLFGDNVDAVASIVTGVLVRGDHRAEAD